jgi:hypothetical protein
MFHSSNNQIHSQNVNKYSPIVCTVVVVVVLVVLVEVLEVVELVELVEVDAKLK